MLPPHYLTFGAPFPMEKAKKSEKSPIHQRKENAFTVAECGIFCSRNWFLQNSPACTARQE